MARKVGKTAGKKETSKKQISDFEAKLADGIVAMIKTPYSKPFWLGYLQERLGFSDTVAFVISLAFDLLIILILIKALLDINKVVALYKLCLNNSFYVMKPTLT